jgi:hypothetical protein
VRGPRPRHPDDDERLLDRDRLDLGVSLDQLGQRQPVTQQTNHTLAQRRTGELSQAMVGFDRGDVNAQSIAEPVAVIEIVTDRGLLDSFGEHPFDVEVDGPGLGVLQDLALNLGQLGRQQIVDVDVAIRRAHAAAPPLRRSAACRLASADRRLAALSAGTPI